MEEGFPIFDLTEELVNPVSIVKLLLERVVCDFGHLVVRNEPNDAEKQIADLLYEKFAKITENYLYAEEHENDFGNPIPDSFAALEDAIDASCSSCSEEYLENIEDDPEYDPDSQHTCNNSNEYVPPRMPVVRVEQKRKILDLINAHPKWTFKSINKKYPSFKHRNYYNVWQKHVENGGTLPEIFFHIHKYTLEQFTEARADFKPVHDIDLRRWAIEKARQFPGTKLTFKASERWVAYFKSLHHITSRKITKVVSKRNIREMEEILESVEAFRSEIQALQRSYLERNIVNTDQFSIVYEIIDTRTLSWKGEKITFGCGFSPRNKATHTFTGQILISVEGEILGPGFVCFQEQSGRMGEQVKSSLFHAPNLVVTCTKSGKLTKSQVEYFFENVVKPNMEGDVLYILDSWGGHIKSDAYENAKPQINLNVKVIPKNATSIAQPLDVYFNRQLKYFMRQVSSFANLNDINITSRNDHIRLQSLTHFTLSAPVFKEMIRFSWIKSGLVNLEQKRFENVRDVCFNFTERQCSFKDCDQLPFYKCSWCKKVICFKHFFLEKTHAQTCDLRPPILR